MNNKAFTLVELIAIIVVLAAIFLVSFPTLINTVKSDEIKKYDDMVEDLCLAGESYIYNNIDEFSELSTKGSTVYLNISTLIDYGSVNKDIKNPKTNEMINSDYIIFNVLGDNSMSCNYKQAKCIITNDNDNSRNLSNWDEVVCGTESFYIIPNDPIAHPTAVEDNVTLLAKYNLNVGSDIVDGVLGIQNKKAIGMQYDSDGNEDYTSCNFTTEQINDFFGGTLGRADDDYLIGAAFGLLLKFLPGFGLAPHGFGLGRIIVDFLIVKSFVIQMSHSCQF